MVREESFIENENEADVEEEEQTVWRLLLFDESSRPETYKPTTVVVVVSEKWGWASSSTKRVIFQVESEMIAEERFIKIAEEEIPLKEKMENVFFESDAVEES